MTSTVYESTITGPSGVTFAASIVVPEEAEFTRMHDLAHLAAGAVVRMVESEPIAAGHMEPWRVPSNPMDEP